MSTVPDLSAFSPEVLQSLASILNTLTATPATASAQGQTSSTPVPAPVPTRQPTPAVTVPESVNPVNHAKRSANDYYVSQAMPSSKPPLYNTPARNLNKMLGMAPPTFAKQSGTVGSGLGSFRRGGSGGYDIKGRVGQQVQIAGPRKAKETKIGRTGKVHRLMLWLSSLYVRLMRLRSGCLHRLWFICT
jgi:hypothetical protein